MTRAKSNSGRDAVKQVQKSVAQAKRDAKALLTKANKDVRQFRSEVSKLKQSGLVSSRVDARSQKVTKYMLGKIRKNADVIEGRSVAVPASPSVRDKYSKLGIFEARGRTIIVPKEYANQRTRIVAGRDLVEISRPLRNGEERRLILPFRAVDMENLASQLRDNPDIDGMKRGDELFGFRLFGHNMQTYGFPDAEELATYILTRYQHLFSGKKGREAVKYFELLRFKTDNSTMVDHDGDKTYHPYPKADATGRSGSNPKRRQYKLNKDAKRKRKERKSETPEKREARLTAQRARSKANRDRNRDK